MLSDARARLPDLLLAPADEAADTAALTRLARWLIRYSPHIAVEDAASLIVDVAGCSHLFGGQIAMLEDIKTRLARAHIPVQIAIAPTVGAAWAMARSESASLTPRSELDARIGPLPVSLLRIPDEMTTKLNRLGLKRIADLTALPRPMLARRFRGQGRTQMGALITRLDQIQGRVREPISPLVPLPRWQVRRSFAEPLLDETGLLTELAPALADLTAELARHGQGLLRLRLDLFGVDGHHESHQVGTSRPSRDADHLMTLLSEQLGTPDMAFGLDGFLLAVVHCTPLEDQQNSLTQAMAVPDEDKLARLVDRLTGRLGPGRVYQLRRRSEILPEDAQAPVLADGRALGWPQHGSDDWEQAIRARPPRPLSLFPRPYPIEVMAEVPDGPPLRFRWRRRTHDVLAAEGPERLTPPWWRGEPSITRDYYRIETKSGARLWLYRAGVRAVPGVRPMEAGPTLGDPSPAWFVHGLFA